MPKSPQLLLFSIRKCWELFCSDVKPNMHLMQEKGDLSELYIRKLHFPHSIYNVPPDGLLNWSWQLLGNRYILIVMDQKTIYQLPITNNNYNEFSNVIMEDSESRYNISWTKYKHRFYSRIQNPIYSISRLQRYLWFEEINKRKRLPLEKLSRGVWCICLFFLFNQTLFK